MATRARFFSVLLGLCVLLLASVAWGQSISVSNTGTAFEITRSERRTDDEQPLSISRQDCIEGAPLGFGDGGLEEEGNFTWLVMRPQITTTTSLNNNSWLEVWVSENADCTKENQRSNLNNCTLVGYSDSVSRTESALFINPRDLVNRDGSTQFNAADDRPESICSDPNNLKQRPVSIYILLRSASDTIDASFKWNQTSVDLSAPPPPDNMTVAPGDSALFFEWEIDSDNEDQDTLGFRFYCVPTGTMSTATSMGGASAVDTSQGGQGGSGPLACNQNVLVDGEFAGPEAIECGSVSGRTARRGDAESVDNGVEYAVGVAAFDTVGNSGKLKVFDECLMPQDVTTFYEGYQGAGGRGGGGFCSYGLSRSATLWWFIALSVGALAWRRRKLS